MHHRRGVEPKKEHTVFRARGEGNLDDILGVIVRAGLLGAVTDTERVVLGVAQAVLVTSLAAQLGGLVVHVVNAHLLDTSAKAQIEQHCN